MKKLTAEVHGDENISEPSFIWCSPLYWNHPSGTSWGMHFNNTVFEVFLLENSWSLNYCFGKFNLNSYAVICSIIERILHFYGLAQLHCKVQDGNAFVGVVLPELEKNDRDCISQWCDVTCRTCPLFFKHKAFHIILVPKCLFTSIRWVSHHAQHRHSSNIPP